MLGIGRGTVTGNEVSASAKSIYDDESAERVNVDNVLQQQSAAVACGIVGWVGVVLCMDIISV